MSGVHFDPAQILTETAGEETLGQRVKVRGNASLSEKKVKSVWRGRLKFPHHFAGQKMVYFGRPFWPRANTYRNCGCRDTGPACRCVRNRRQGSCRPESRHDLVRTRPATARPARSPRWNRCAAYSAAPTRSDRLEKNGQNLTIGSHLWRNLANTSKAAQLESTECEEILNCNRSRHKLKKLRLLNNSDKNKLQKKTDLHWITSHVANTSFLFFFVQIISYVDVSFRMKARSTSLLWNRLGCPPCAAKLTVIFTFSGAGLENMVCRVCNLGDILKASPLRACLKNSGAKWGHTNASTI